MAPMKMYIERTESKPKIWKPRIKVFGEAEDSETPIVILQFFDYDGNLEYERHMEDCFAHELIGMIHDALLKLPSSK